MSKKSKDGTTNSILSMVKEGVKHLFSFGTIVESLKKKIEEVVERAIKQLIASLLMLAGTICIVIAILFFMMEYLNLNKTTTFLIAGIVFFLLAFIMKYNVVKKGGS